MDLLKNSLHFGTVKQMSGFRWLRADVHAPISTTTRVVREGQLYAIVFRAGASLGLLWRILPRPWGTFDEHASQ